MTWGDESDEQNSKFQEVALPPGFLDDPKQDIAGLSQNAPEVEPAESAPRAGQRNLGPAAGKETWNRRLRPRHRQVIRRYFDSSE